MFRSNWVRIPVIIAVLLFGIAACSFAGNATGLLVPKRSLTHQLNLLPDHIDVRLPESADGPVPAVIMFHGCGGLRQVQEDYAADVLAAGYAVMIVDSNGARGIGRFGAMTQVCTALRLWGQDRAADVAVALANARSIPGIDAERLALIGWSHGGWTLLDALGYSGSGAQPRALSDAPITLPGQVSLVVLMYPYCGYPVRTDGSDIDHRVEVRAILAENDVIAPPNACQRVLETGRSAGASIEYETWPGQTHAFDEPNAPPFDPRIIYDAEAAARARADVVSWLDIAFAQG